MAASNNKKQTKTKKAAKKNAKKTKTHSQKAVINTPKSSTKKNHPSKPTSVTGPKRESETKFSISWKHPSDYTDKDKGWSKGIVTISYDGGKMEAGKNIKHKDNDLFIQQVSRDTTTWTENMNSANRKAVNRSQWHPLKNGRYLHQITMLVSGYNKHGTANANVAKIVFKEPKKPTAEFDYDDATGLLTVTCKSSSTDTADRYDCVYHLYRQDKGTASARYNKGKRAHALDNRAKEIKGTFRTGEKELVTNNECLTLIQGSSITFTLELEARGFKGNVKKVFSYVIEPPPPPTIEKIALTNSDIKGLAKQTVTRAFASGQVVVRYGQKKKSSAKYNPAAATDYSLQRLVTAYSVDSSVKAAVLSGWEEVDTNMGTTAETAKKTTRDEATMGEPTVDVLEAMGFNQNAHIYDKRVWYRVKAVRQGMVAYSEPKDVPELRCPVPTAANDYSGFMALSQNTLEPGKAIDGAVGWDNARNDDEGVNNPNWQDATWTTIVEWSEHKNAIESNEKPNILEIDWENKAATHTQVLGEYTRKANNNEFGKHKNGSYPVPWLKSANFTIYGLSPGVKYYLWTRRHMVLGEYDSYGPRTAAPSDYFPFVPVDNPTAISVFTEERYIAGRDLTISWTHNATCEQKTWSVYAIPGEDNYTKKYTEDTMVSKIHRKLLANGSGRTNSVKIKASILNAIQPVCVYSGNSTFKVSRKLGLMVGVSTGGKEVLSCQDIKGRYTGAVFVDIGRPPSGTMYTVSEWKSQPGYVYLLSRTNEEIDGIVNVFAKYDTSIYLPDGEHLQPAGECVFTYRTSAFYSVKDPKNGLNKKEKALLASYVTGSSAYAYYAKVEVRAPRSLHNGSQYIVQGYFADRDDKENSLVSEATNIEITCDYKHKASVCGPKSRIEAEIAVSSAPETGKTTVGGSYKDGITFQFPMAKILPRAPIGRKKGDRCDIYRITPDGAVRIYENAKFNKTVTDNYAPFSWRAVLRYAIVTVTADGDYAGRELRYSLVKHGIRFDWGSLDIQRCLELPFNIELSDSYDKDVRIDTYKDGSVAALFNKAVKHTSTGKTKLIRYDPAEFHKEPVKYELLKELAKYPGPAFFRADNGAAYECVVEVEGLKDNYDELVSDVTLKMTEINPPSDRYTPMAAKDKKSFEAPKVVGTLPTGTVNAADAVGIQLDAVETEKVFTKSLALYSSVTSKSKKGVSTTKVSNMTTYKGKVYNEVTMPFHMVTTMKHVFLEFDAVMLDLTKTDASKVTETDWGVWVDMRYYEGGTHLKTNRYVVGSMNKLNYNALTTTNGQEIKRKKTDRTIVVKPRVFLLPKEVACDKTVSGFMSYTAKTGNFKGVTVMVSMKAHVTTKVYGGSDKVKATVDSVSFTVSRIGGGSAPSAKEFYDKVQVALVHGSTIKSCTPIYRFKPSEKAGSFKVGISMTVSDVSGTIPFSLIIQPDKYNSLLSYMTTDFSVKRTGCKYDSDNAAANKRLSFELKIPKK